MVMLGGADHATAKSLAKARSFVWGAEHGTRMTPGAAPCGIAKRRRDSLPPERTGVWGAEHGRRMAYAAPQLKEDLAPQVGFEPTTFRLTAERSTIELLRNGRLIVSRGETS